VVRGIAGLPPIDCNDALQQATRAHVAYMMQNPSTDAHGETPGKPGFTGSSPGERDIAAGYQGSPTLEAAGPFGLMIGSVYHRLPFLAFGSGDYGYSNGYYDFGARPAVPPGMVATWPADGSTSPTNFIHVVEGPDPLPDVADLSVGYPVSLHASEALAITSATLSGPEGAIDVYTLTSANDGSHFIQNEIFLVPKQPLMMGNTYTASFAGTVGGVAFTKVTHFLASGSDPFP
jgi:hypothetical protein